MRITTLLIGSALILGGCGGNETEPSKPSETNESSSSVKAQAGKTVFTHTITSMGLSDRNYCDLVGSITNESGMAIHTVNMTYEVKLTPEEAESRGRDGGNMAGEIAADASTGVLPLQPGEVRDFTFTNVGLKCDHIASMELKYFVCRAANPDGTIKYRAIECDASMLDVDSRIELPVSR